MKQRNKHFEPKQNSNHEPPIFHGDEESIPKPKKVEIVFPKPKTTTQQEDKQEETKQDLAIESLMDNIRELSTLLHNVTIERDRLSKDLKDTSDALKYKELSIFALQASLDVQTDLINYYKDRIKELENKLDK